MSFFDNGWVLVFFAGMIKKAMTVVFVILLMQLPGFVEAYIQRLGGHVSELKIYLLSMERVAKKHRKTLDQYVNKFCDSPDLEVRDEGVLMKKRVLRYESLSRDYQTLKSSDTLKRLVVFPFVLKPSIAKETLFDYTPTLPLNLASLILGGLGVVISELLSWVFSRRKDEKQVV